MPQDIDELGLVRAPFCLPSIQQVLAEGRRQWEEPGDSGIWDPPPLGASTLRSPHPRQAPAPMGQGRRLYNSLIRRCAIGSESDLVHLLYLLCP